MLKRRSVLAGAAGWTIVGAQAVRAQTWPSQPIKIVVPYIPGGATDTAGRIVAEKMTATPCCSAPRPWRPMPRSA